MQHRSFAHTAMLSVVLIVAAATSVLAIRVPISDTIEGEVFYQSYPGPTPAYGDFAKFRCRIPDIPEVKGAILKMGHDSKDDAYRDMYWQLAKSIDFALIGSQYCCDVKYIDPTTHPETVVKQALKDFAAESGHPELEFVHLCAFGFSEGGVASHALNCAAPERLMAYVPAAAAMGRSCVKGYDNIGMFAMGETDMWLNRWTQVRSGGALAGVVVHWAMGHNVWGPNYQLILPFFYQVAKLMVPEGASAKAAPMTLNRIPEDQGWLGDRGTWKTNWAYVAPYGEYNKGDKRDASWLPNEYMARVWQATQAPSPEVYIASFRDLGTAVSGQPDLSAYSVEDAIDFVALWQGQGAIQKMSFYSGSDLLGVATETDEDPFENGFPVIGLSYYTLKDFKLKAGIHSMIAVGERADGSKTISKPKAIVVHETPTLPVRRTTPPPSSGSSSSAIRLSERRGVVTARVAPGAMTVQLVNGRGQQLRVSAVRHTPAGTEAVVPVEGLAPGAYLVVAEGQAVTLILER